MKPKTYYSNGKLLLTGEYVVLDGALSLAVPTKFGQSLKVEPIAKKNLVWKSLDEKGNIWFEYEFLFQEISFPFVYEANLENHTDDIAKTLLKVLYKAIRKHRFFFSDYINSFEDRGLKLTTKLDFPKNWGLGTSSTLINNIAQWVDIDPYFLLRETFSGSGYDIACAQNDTPITYQLQKGRPTVKQVDFNPVFKEQLYFVHLNKKQNSRDGIKHYNANKENLSAVISDINNISSKMIVCNNISDFETLLAQHENIIAKVTKQTPVKELLFKDFNGSIKSLGAWGGDFILVSSKETPTDYFKAKGFETVIPYIEMVL